jgi:hypothetical protein
MDTMASVHSANRTKLHVPGRKAADHALLGYAPEALTRLRRGTLGIDPPERRASRPAPSR